MHVPLRALICGAAVALVVLACASAVVPPSEDFNPSNPYWNGLERFCRAFNASAISSPEALDPGSTVLFVVGPSFDASARAEAWKLFVEGGGILVLMDEVGLVNGFLESLGLEVRVNGSPMLDAAFYYRSWRLPRASSLGLSDVTEGVESVVIDVPSVLELRGNAEGLRVLAWSSSFSFLDVNRDGEPSQGEPSGPFPLAVEASYGRGRILLFSDSSIPVNGVVELGDNLKLLESVASGRRVAVDVGVWSRPTSSIFRELVLSARSAASSPDVKYSLAAVALAASLYVGLKAGGPAVGAEPLEELMRRHPDWDRRILEELWREMERC
ncbi:MAG: hypothetical protein QFX33_04030 [Candidatus Nezhaarchaeota archaeon]|nr:hypothetical protein [Candidatus Nezhaarchaeota archaeon]